MEPELQVEVACLQPSTVRTVLVPQLQVDERQRNRVISPNAQQQAAPGSGAFLEGHAHHCLAWSFPSGERDTLELTEASSASELPTGVRIRFPQQLYPKAAFASSSEGSQLSVLTAEGRLYALRLPPPPASGASLLSGVNSSANFFSSRPIAAQLQQVGQPTALASCAGHVCIAGQNGGILCIPDEAIDNQTADSSFELKEAGSTVQRLITGFFSRAAAPPAVALSVLQQGGQQLLCAVYSDGSLRIWSLARQQRVLLEMLSTPGGAHAPVRMTTVQQPGLQGTAAAHVAQHAPSQLVMQFEAAKHTNEAPVFVVYTLDVTTKPDTSFSISLRQSAVLHPQNLIAAATADMLAYQSQQGELRLHILAEDGHMYTLREGGDQLPETRMLDMQMRHLYLFTEEQLQLQDRLWRAVQKHAAASPASLVLPPSLALDHMVRLLLTPRQLSRPALHAALNQLGLQVALEDVQTRDLDALHSYVVQVLNTRGPNVPELASGQLLLNTYWEQWRALHPASALLRHPSTGAAAVLRGGCAVSLLRDGSPEEVLQAGAGLPRQAGGADVAQLQVCMDALRRSLGSINVELFAALFRMGADAVRNILPAYIAALSKGPDADQQPSRPGSAGMAGSAAMLGLGEWRRQRLQLGLHIGAALEAISDPVTAIRSYIQLLDSDSADLQRMLASTGSGASTSGQPRTPSAAGTTVTLAAHQLAGARFAAARDLLLLVAFLKHAGRLGSWSLSDQQAAQLNSLAVPQLLSLLHRSAVALWLCETPATQASVGSRDATVLMHQLRLGPDGQPIMPTQPRGRASETSLAQLLYARFAQQQGIGSTSQHDMHSIATRFYRFLASGGSADTASAAPAAAAASGGGVVASDEEALQQVLHVGLELFQSKELDALLALVRMTGSLADNPGLLFFKGYSTLHLLKRTQEPASRRRILAEAARPLFRAAACLLPQNASQPPSNGSSRQLLRQLLQQVLTDTTGSYTDEGPQAVVLQYYELLMMVCERLGSPEGAAAFAQAAVQQVDVAYPNDKDEEARARREGRLWANLFVYALDAGAFEEAYAALQANPLPERKLDCLQRLVVTLCARGEIQTLCRLPYSGNCKKQQNGSTTLVSLLEEAQHVLQRRAEHAEVAARPQPYQVLYDFHTARSNYKSAALAQLSLARRLRDEAADAPGVLPQIERALGAAVNALSLVEPAAAWLEDPFPAGPAPEALLRKGGRGTPGSSRYLTDVTNGATAKQSSRSILSLADLQKEHAVAHAHVLVAKQLPTADLGHSSRDDIFQHLLSAGLFDAAVSMATAVFEGAALTRALERALASMAAACVRLQLREEMPQAAAMSSGRGASSWLEGDAQSTVSAAALWSQLRRCLWQYDNARHAFRLRLAVLDAVLANERRLKLPAWLLALFEVREDAAKAAGMSGNGADPAALLRAYLKYGRLEDAASLALRHLQAWDDEVMDIYRQRSCISWFPYGLLETLIARLAAAQSEPLRALQRQLSDAVERHKQAALRQSAILEERLQLRR